MNDRRRFPDWIVSLALFAVNLLILGPYLPRDFTDQPWNNGYGYLAIARAFRDHKWTWNPLQYGGAPFHYLYPPLFHLLLGLFPGSLGRSYHLLTGFAYALAPVCLYLLASRVFQSRVIGAFAGIVYSCYPSPAYSFLPTWKNLALPYAHAPWSFVAMAGYEEAAHGFALPLTLLAVTAAWRNRWVLAAVLSAAVFLTSLPALVGLGLLLGAVGIAKVRELGLLQAGLHIAGTAGTAYALSAFWISPGYLLSSSLVDRIVLRPTLFAAPWNRTTWLILACAAALIGLSFWRRVTPALSLVLCWLALAGAIVVAYTLVGNYFVPMPHRYMLEFNVGLVLALAGFVSLVPAPTRPALAAVMLLAASPAAWSFLSHAWRVQPSVGDEHAGVIYQLAQWLNRNADGARVVGSGEFDLNFALWSDVPQLGGSGQDVSNFLMFAAQRQIALGCEVNSGRLGELWLQAVGARYFVVHDAASREYFHWFSDAGKYSRLGAAWTNGAGDTIYNVPGPDSRKAVVVDLASMARLPAFRSTADETFLASYVAWSAGKRPARLRWSASDRAEIDTDLRPGEAVLVKLNHDPGWRVSNGETGRDPLGFLLIRGAAGRLTLRFGATWDVWLARTITALAILLLLARVSTAWITALAIFPTLAAYAVLATAVPATARIAEEAFTRIQSPLINPGGIVDAVTNQPPIPGRTREIAAYGNNFGAATDSTRVWVDDRQAELVYHAPHQVVFKLPAAVSAKTEIGIEVNGCRGNAFTLGGR